VHLLLPEIGGGSHLCDRSEDLLKGVYKMGFQKPSKIQERALPLLLQDPCVARAQYNVR
jgi:superfamily II DNA/RNA helicase